MNAAELSGVHSEDLPMSMAVTILVRDTDAIRADALEEAKVALLSFARKVSEMHAAADAFDQQKTVELFTQVRDEYQSLRSYYPKDLLATAQRLAERYTCPMHPDIVGPPTSRCSRCGMELDQPLRTSLHGGVGGIPVRQTVTARIRTNAPLQPGRPADGILELTSFGRPVLVTDLRIVHTERTHLLIVDPSLADYHHVHPQPTETPGEYRFTFTPRKSGGYRAWADVRTTTTGLQEYAMADIDSPAAGDATRDTTVRLHSEVNGLRFNLALAGPEIQVGQPMRATLRVAGSDGRPFTGLEPVMGAFAHIVGFADDYRSVLHTHPTGERPLKPEDRGGPELAFLIYATQAGFYRLFVQVQIGDASLFVPFGLHVRPDKIGDMASSARTGR